MHHIPDVSTTPPELQDCGAQEVGEEEAPSSPRAKLGARRTSLHRLSSASESIEEGDEEEAARKEAVEAPLSNGSPEEGVASNSVAGAAFPQRMRTDCKAGAHYPSRCLACLVFPASLGHACGSSLANVCTDI